MSLIFILLALLSAGGCDNSGDLLDAPLGISKGDDDSGEQPEIMGTLTHVKTITLQSRPDAIAYRQSNNCLYTACGTSNIIEVYNLEGDLQSSFTTSVVDESSRHNTIGGLVFRNDELWLTTNGVSSDSYLHQISLDDGTEIKSYFIEHDEIYFANIAYIPSRDHFWIMRGLLSYIWVMNASTGTIVAKYTNLGAPEIDGVHVQGALGLAYTGEKMFAGINYEGYLIEINLDDGEFVMKYDHDNLSDPKGMAWTGEYLLVGNDVTNQVHFYTYGDR